MERVILIEKATTFYFYFSRVDNTVLYSEKYIVKVLLIEIMYEYYSRVAPYNVNALFKNSFDHHS